MPRPEKNPGDCNELRINCQYRPGGAASVAQRAAPQRKKHAADTQNRKNPETDPHTG
jgi:hypothetical protein